MRAIVYNFIKPFSEKIETPIRDTLIRSLWIDISGQEFLQ